MPLFGWMKWPNQTRAQTRSPSRVEPAPGHTLLTELLWHVEERERLARQLERENRLAHSALGLRWFQKYPKLRTLVSSSELHQLEFLCSQVPPVDTAAVVSRLFSCFYVNNIQLQLYQHNLEPRSALGSHISP